MKELLSPEAAKFVSATFLGLMVLVYAFRFGLSREKRDSIKGWLHLPH